MAAMGAGLVGVQVVILIIWNVIVIPEASCTLSTTPVVNGVSYFACKAMQNFGQYFCFSYAYNIFLALIVSVLSVLTIKWRTQSGGGSCLVSILVTLSAWALMGVVHTVYQVSFSPTKFIGKSTKKLDSLNIMFLIVQTV